jgi:RHS repeat-associated protein
LIAALKKGSTTLEQMSYDPWGRKRSGTNWLDYENINTPFTDLYKRGYTGHEHIDAFGLINMNGRMYDPRLGRFLSPDPFVQAPGYTQSYNRYSYGWNNPMKYTDPTGYKNVATREYSEYGVEDGNYSNFIRLFGYGSSGIGSIIGGPRSLPGANWVNAPAPTYYDTKMQILLDQLRSGRLVYKLDRYVVIDAYIDGPSGNNIGYYYEWFLDGNLIDADSWGFERPSIEDWFISAVNSNTFIGAVTGIVGNNYALSRNHTYRYASGGKSAQQLTKLHFAHSMKVANFLGKINIATGVIGVTYSLININVALNTGNPVNPWDVSDAAVGSMGVGAGVATLFLSTNPVGWTVAAGIGLGVGVYFGFRLIHDLSTND